MIGVLTKRGSLNADIHRRIPRADKAEIGVMYLQVKNSKDGQ